MDTHDAVRVVIPIQGGKILHLKIVRSESVTDRSKQTTGMYEYRGEASWHVFAEGFKMIIIVSNDRKCPDRTSRLAVFSGLSGFDR